ncbi:MAG: TolC family outer membrane protein [Caulobacteraceae bacterium]|nr:TolC family outer membrane protein [Caulobacteraceae bacterium]
MRIWPALGVMAAISLPGLAAAMSLPEAITLAQASNPTLAQSRAAAEGADARLSQARAARLPSVVLSGQSGWGTTNLGGFFGFGRRDVSPRGAALAVIQPVFAGGAINAGIDRARSGRDAALARTAGDKALLSAQVAEAYVIVGAADQRLVLQTAQVRQLETIADQAALKFKDGAVPRTDLDQARARLAGAQADLARAQGDVVRARARFADVVGAPPEGLDPSPISPPIPVSLDEAMATAMRSSPMLLAAQASARAAEAGVRYAAADRLPTVALTASASTTRDQFFPGYRDDGLTVGVQGRWTLFSGGLTSGRIREANADERAARAALDAARAQVREAVIDAWQEVETARAVTQAASDQSLASTGALESVRNEVRVGQKPTLDLLDAEREALAARNALVLAKGQQVIDAYRLNALLHGQ